MVKHEALVILQEEAAEVIQSCSKIIRFGWDNTFCGSDNRESLTRELGDLLCMIDILIEQQLIKAEELDIASKHKRDKLEIWSGLDLKS